jgi:hypothetical protein
MTRKPPLRTGGISHHPKGVLLAHYLRSGEVLTGSF